MPAFSRATRGVPNPTVAIAPSSFTHDPPLALGGRELHPDDARGVCRDCHKRLTAELRDELGLPFAPNVGTAGP